MENIGIDGSQRYSDIHNTGGVNNSESIIQFDPKKDLGDKDQNPNLFSQHLTAMEGIKFHEMLEQAKTTTISQSSPMKNNGTDTQYAGLKEAEGIAAKASELQGILFT